MKGKERRRIRLKTMAAELGISVRAFRTLFAMGMPCTQLQGIIWFEPDKVHKWLDQFNATGSPGIKRTEGFRVIKKNADQSN
jgi:hypothetical protein